MRVHVTTFEQVLELIDLLSRRRVDASVSISGEWDLHLALVGKPSETEALQFRLDVRSWLRTHALVDTAAGADT